MKKILLGLGTIAAVVAPIVAVVSCGKGHQKVIKKGEEPKSKGKTPFETKGELETNVKVQIDNSADADITKTSTKTLLQLTALSGTLDAASLGISYSPTPGTEV
ncbi:MAG: hypothetical protein KAG14_01680, partial [Mycoplasmataceae bacterium]|nr:hypothetical protein [Mycoplasmataceae bacterium]